MTGRTTSIRSTIFPERGLHVSPGFFLMLAAALLAGGTRATAAVLLAAAMHEGGHLLLLGLLGAPVEGIRLGAFGAEIRAYTERLSYGKELLATLAGPAANLVSAPLIALLAARCGWAWGYLFAGAHAVLGVYNLLPIPPLDGARALYLAVADCCGPDAGERAGRCAGLACAAVLTGFGAYWALAWGGALFLLAALGLLLPQLGLAKKRVTV